MQETIGKEPPCLDAFVSAVDKRGFYQTVKIRVTDTVVCKQNNLYDSGSNCEYG